ncbi:hypothetical protein C3K52_04875 [Citrobacter freundii]|nr:hypothetical protein CFA70_02195 [Citrobacter freundii]OYR04779.1 hypothetical protein B9P86_02570 [Citrobacter freundii]POV68988.1 hypothetical protein C3404_01900 [Citrobacter freundii complex sp. CFNIH11]PSM63325.1 hypothetical protein C3K52_04875 [Citrobacter freundii]THE50661.1 hypothetical protein DJ483_01060 [Citrobacter freundii]
MSKYFTLLPVMWFKRINRVQLTALSPLNYHFHNECEMEKRFPLSDLRAKFEKSIIASFLARVARFLLPPAQAV